MGEVKIDEFHSGVERDFLKRFEAGFFTMTAADRDTYDVANNLSREFF